MFVFAGSRRPSVAARRLGAVSLVVMLLGATLLVAAGGPAAAQAKNAEVDGTAQNKWEPANVTVPVGGTVTFKISGGAPHPVKSGSPPNGDNAFDASACGLAQMNKTGASCKVTFKKAGSFPYFCQVHFSLGMTGTITVGSGGGGGATATTAGGSGGTPVVTAPEAAPATTPGKPGVFWLGYGLLAMGALLALAALAGYLRFSPGFRRGRR
jgi:plastocyanin